MLLIKRVFQVDSKLVVVKYTVSSAIKFYYLLLHSYFGESRKVAEVPKSNLHKTKKKV